METGAESKVVRKSDRSIVLGDGSADHMGKGTTEIRSPYRKHRPGGRIGYTMKTSLWGIANKAKENKNYRFVNLACLLTADALHESFRALNKRAAAGVDRISARQYEKNLEQNIEDLVERLKNGSYKANMIRRVHIPRANGKTRPLGIPILEDRLVQHAAARILSSIHEQDFLSCSYGYRPNLDARNAVRDLYKTLQFGHYNYVVEMDIRGFFDNIDHDWLTRMVERRVADRRFTRLIRKWLKAKVMESDGASFSRLTGVPQGGVISPVLANIYLHYVLDLWFERKVKKECRGAVDQFRYADDAVYLFSNREDAERFFRELPSRLEKFGLKMAEEKSRIIRFSRAKYGENGSFDFLGFEFKWATNRNGRRVVRRRTSRSKFRSALRNFTLWCRKTRGLKLRSSMPVLRSKLLGYYNYYGVIGNSKSLSGFYYMAMKILFRWLNRRSQRKSMTWDTFNLMIKSHRIPQPRIVESQRRQLDLSFS